MPLQLNWTTVAIRLALALLTSAIIGMNRGGRGRAAGLRTTTLVSLAAALSMLEANALLATSGKAADSFVVLDLMRLPLGILSGMGFIGAGAILRKGELVIGLTTAATLWFVTVMGLCFGGGQIGLGLCAFAIAFGTLYGLKIVENKTRRERIGTLVISAAENAPKDTELRPRFIEKGYHVTACGLGYDQNGERRTLTYQLSWRTRPSETEPPAFLETMAHLPGVFRLDWRPQDLAE